MFHCFYVEFSLIFLKSWKKGPEGIFPLCLRQGFLSPAHLPRPRGGAAGRGGWAALGCASRGGSARGRRGRARCRWRSDKATGFHVENLMAIWPHLVALPHGRHEAIQPTAEQRQTYLWLSPESWCVTAVSPLEGMTGTVSRQKIIICKHLYLHFICNLTAIFSRTRGIRGKGFSGYFYNLIFLHTEGGRAQILKDKKNRLCWLTDKV